MASTEPRPLRPAVHRDGTVPLGDYRGRSPLLLAFFRGIYCPFCRRQIAKLGPYGGGWHTYWLLHKPIDLQINVLRGRCQALIAPSLFRAGREATALIASLRAGRRRRVGA
jgi:hypothetical protein